MVACTERKGPTSNTAFATLPPFSSAFWHATLMHASYNLSLLVHMQVPVGMRECVRVGQSCQTRLYAM